MPSSPNGTSKALGGVGFSFNKAAFTALVVESVLYGTLFLSYCITAIVLLRQPSARTSQHKVNRPLMVIATLMFLMATAHLIVNFWRSYNAFVTADVPPQTWLISRGTSTVDFVLKNVLLDAQILLGDAFLIWRLFVVFSRMRRVVAPFIFIYIVSFGTAITVLVLHTIRPPHESTFDKQYAIPALIFFLSTMTVNVGCSTLIAYRVWAAYRAVHAAFPHRRNSIWQRLILVAALFLESASVYAAVIVACFVCLLVNSGAMKVALDAAMQIVGISFCGIILSLQLGLASAASPSSSPTGSSGFSPEPGSLSTVLLSEQGTETKLNT